MLTLFSGITAEAASTKTIKKTCYVGNTCSFYIKINGFKVSPSKVKYKSSNKNIMTVNKKGIGIAKKVGKVTIKAKYNGLTAVFKVTVKKSPYEDIESSETAGDGYVGNTSFSVPSGYTYMCSCFGRCQSCNGCSSCSGNCNTNCGGRCKAACMTSSLSTVV